ncbi:hypothetical protein Tco_1092341 [Tanacetum coccineum]|uniref:Uncharacterized protein n=1 Tax=Tanacetum coccineum TaxID=301880 RepID=A0ABQ5I9Q7_9ASTR
MTQELEKCKTNLDETNSALGEAISCRDSCLIALQNKQNEFEKYKAFNDRTIDYEILQTKLNETLGLLALKDIEIKEGYKTKAYEISVLNRKHNELVKKSLLTKSQLEGYLKENTKVISDLKDLKAQMQDKNIAISELKKLIEMFKRKGVDTNFEPTIRSWETPPVQSIRNQPVELAQKHVSHHHQGKKVRTQMTWFHHTTLEKAKKSATTFQKDKDVNGKPRILIPARLPQHANGISFNGQKQQRIDLNTDALYNEKQENLRVWLLKLLISKKPVPRNGFTKDELHQMVSAENNILKGLVPQCLVLYQMTSDHNRLELGIHDHNNEPSSSKLVPKVVP